MFWIRLKHSLFGWHYCLSQWGFIHRVYFDMNGKSFYCDGREHVTFTNGRTIWLTPKPLTMEGFPYTP